MVAQPFLFACPRCHTKLVFSGPEEQYCARDKLHFSKTEGIWRFILPERQTHFEQFIHEYETVRSAEGRGSSNSAYYRALPFKDLSGKMRFAWRIRAASFVAFLAQVLEPLEKENRTPLKILDLGAGNGWLSNRLAARGHQVAAVDLLVNPMDGLGAHIHYATTFESIQAEYDRLPLEDSQCDLVVFNASFHYSENYEASLAEAKRVLRSDGQIVISDSPVYRHPASGRKMVQERESQFQAKYGFPSNALKSENFLTYNRLEDLTGELGLTWQLLAPHLGAAWALRSLLGRLRTKRELAKFPLLVGRQLQKPEA